MNDYAERRSRIYSWIASEGLDAAYLTRDADVRYLTGMPSDSLLVLLAEGKSVLLPWDINLANRLAAADEIIPYTEYRRDLATALSAVLAGAGLDSGCRIEIPGDTAYPRVKSLEASLGKTLPGVEIVCRDNGLDDTLHRLRAKKSVHELAILSDAATMTDSLINGLEAGFADGSLVSELDVALFLEREARALGAEGTGFDTLVAGPGRSNGIHAFPTYTDAPFRARGCGIIDFGVKCDGYTSDVTVSVVFGEPTDTQQEMISLVQQAYNEATAMCAPGADATAIAEHVDRLFEEAGYSMPHSLGHGIGLDVHEEPRVSSKSKERVTLEPGMVITIEPGLYHESQGGVRLENDVIILETGSQIITTSRILRFPDPG